MHIVITGPESTGKTTLTRSLAAHFGVAWVPEYARVYLADMGRGYQYEDLEKIARGQLERETKLLKEGAPYLFSDTGMLVLKVWAEYRFGRYPAIIQEILEGRSYDLFLLCDPNIPWEYDPMRENPHDREDLYQIYLQELQKLGKPYLEVRGSVKERMKQVLEGLG